MASRITSIRAATITQAPLRKRPGERSRTANRQNLKPGDRLLFSGGNIFPGNLVLGADDAGTRERPVVVGSYGWGRATIEAGLGTAVLVKDAGGVEIRDLVFAGANPTKNHGCGVAFVNTLPGNVRLDHVWIRNVEARGFGCDIKALVDQTGGFRPPAGCEIFVRAPPLTMARAASRTFGSKAASCTTNHGEKRARKMLGGKAVGLFADPRLDLTAPRTRRATCRGLTG